MIHTSEFFDNFGQLLVKYPNIELTDAFSKGQINSKRWLVNTVIDLDLDLGTVFICGGWYALLATFLIEANIKLKAIRSFDIDDSCAAIADTMNRTWVMNGWKFKASTLDITKFTYPLKYVTKRSDGSLVELTEMPDTLINTSCEHIDNFSEWYSQIPSGTILILQGNDYYEIPEHINCSKDIHEFSEKTPMSTVLYQGELVLEKYTRFMKIGIK